MGVRGEGGEAWNSHGDQAPTLWLSSPLICRMWCQKAGLGGRQCGLRGPKIWLRPSPALPPLFVPWLLVCGMGMKSASPPGLLGDPSLCLPGEALVCAVTVLTVHPWASCFPFYCSGGADPCSLSTGWRFSAVRLLRRAEQTCPANTQYRGTLSPPLLPTPAASPAPGGGPEGRVLTAGPRQGAGTAAAVLLRGFFS